MGGYAISAATELLKRVREEERRAIDLEKGLKESLDKLAQRTDNLRQAAQRLESLVDEAAVRFHTARQTMGNCTVVESGYGPTDPFRGSPGRPESIMSPGEFRHAVGLPNRNCDCFWLAALQCLRHTPNFCAALTQAVHGAFAKDDLTTSLERLYSDMLLAEESKLPADTESLHDFRCFANAQLPASDSNRKLLQPSADQQRQQDTHEFLSQLLHHFGSMGSSRNGLVSQEAHPGRLADVSFEHLEKLESEFSEACANFRRSKSAAAGVRQIEESKLIMWNVAYEYVQQQWESSLTRMNAEFGQIFEGQRLATVHCTECERTGLSGAEPFTVEEVQLAARAQDEGFLSRVSSLFTTTEAEFGLVDLLKEGAESPAPEGYRCPNARCGKIGCSVRKIQYVRLPATLVFHINRAQPDGSRCSKILDFEPMMDLREYNLVTHFGRPMNYSWAPCSTKYALFGAVFHKGHSANSGHYLAFVNIDGNWVIVNDHRVTRASEPSRTPMAFEANEPEDGAKVALLFYRRSEVSN